MNNKPPVYDPKLAQEQRAKRIYDALKDVIEFGKAIILPNPKSGYAQGIVTKKQKGK